MESIKTAGQVIPKSSPTRSATYGAGNLPNGVERNGGGRSKCRTSAGRKKIIGYNYINKRRLFEEPRDAAGVLQAYNVSDVSDTVVNDVEDILCKAFRLKIFSNTEDDGSPNSDNEYDPPSFAIYPLLSNDKLC